MRILCVWLLILNLSHQSSVLTLNTDYSLNFRTQGLLENMRRMGMKDHAGLGDRTAEFNVSSASNKLCGSGGGHLTPAGSSFLL